MSTLALTIMASYLLVVAAIGFGATRLVKTSNDFLVAGRKLGPFLVIAGLTATHIGGGTVMGVSTESYTFGVSGIAYSVGTAVGLILLGLVAAKKMRSLSLYTITDYLALRYDSALVRGLGAALSLVAVTGIVGAQVTAAGGALSIIGIDPTTGAIIAMLLFIGYTVFAGMWGVALTDATQVIIVLVGLPIVAVFGLQAIGGIDGLQSFAAGSAEVSSASYFSPVGMGTWAMLGIITPVIMYNLIGQDFYQRLFSARSATVARASAIAAGVLLLAFAAFPVIAGMSSRAIVGEVEDPASALPELIIAVLPAWLGAILVAAILAAIMSTADSLLIAGTSHVTNDFYRKIMGRDPDGDSKRTLVIARVWTVILGVGALAFALAVPGIIEMLALAYTMFASGIFVPVIGGLFWSRATTPGAVSAIAVGSVAGLLGSLGVLDYGGVPDIAVGGLCSLLAFVTVSLMTTPPANQDVTVATMRSRDSSRV